MKNLLRIFWPREFFPPLARVEELFLSSSPCEGMTWFLRVRPVYQCLVLWIEHEELKTLKFSQWPPCVCKITMYIFLPTYRFRRSWICPCWFSRLASLPRSQDRQHYHIAGLREVHWALLFYIFLVVKMGLSHVSHCFSINFTLSMFKESLSKPGTVSIYISVTDITAKIWHMSMKLLLIFDMCLWCHW